MTDRDDMSVEEAEQQAESVNLCGLEGIELTAARWVFNRQGRNWSAAQEGQLEQWLDASPAHRVAFMKAGPVWRKIDWLKCRSMRLTIEGATFEPLSVRAAEPGEDRPDFSFHPSRWRALRESALNELRLFHALTPTEPGPDVERWRLLSSAALSRPIWRKLMVELLREKLLILGGAWVCLPQQRAALHEADKELLHELRQALGLDGFDQLWVRDLAEATRKPQDRVRELLRKAAGLGLMYQISWDWFYAPESVRSLAGIACQLTQVDGVVTAAGYRDFTGLGRKRAVRILEFFERVGYLEWTGNYYEIRIGSCWNEIGLEAWLPPKDA
jgi:Elongation factor SelB, winged helix